MLLRTEIERDGSLSESKNCSEIQRDTRGNMGPGGAIEAPCIYFLHGVMVPKSNAREKAKEWKRDLMF